MKKYVVTTVLFICFAFLGGTFGKHPVIYAPEMVQNVLDHSLAVVSYFDAPPGVAEKVIKRINNVDIQNRDITPGWPLAVPIAGQDGATLVAIIGAATLLKDNYAITVAHLFQLNDDQGQPLKLFKSWVLQRNTDHPIEVNVVAKTNLSSDNDFYNDYAVVKLREDLGLRGLSISEESAAQGDPVFFAGSINGVAFFARFGFVTEFHKFFRRDDQGQLHLSQWTDFPFVCVYPGGGGDSGGGVFNTKGKLVGVMYCGVEIASVEYIFTNPLTLLKEFLTNNKLGKLLK